MNIKKKKIIVFLGSLGLLGGIIATIVATSVSTNHNTNNLINTTSVSNDSSPTQINNLENSKAAITGDFLLNDQNAISLENNTTNNAYSSTSGPKGFISLQNTKITYTAYDGQILWASQLAITGDHHLVAVDYNDNSKCFVALISRSDRLEMVSIKETGDGSTLSTQTMNQVPSMKQLNRSILTRSAGSYLIVPQVQENTTTYTGWYIDVNADGTLTSPSLIEFPSFSSNEVVVSVGCYRYTGTNIYRDRYVVLSKFNPSTRIFRLALYKQTTIGVGIGESLSGIALVNHINIGSDTTDSATANIIDNNSKEINIYTQSAADIYTQTNYIYCILNYDKNTTQISIFSQINTYDPGIITPSTTSNLVNLNKHLYLSGVVDLDIYQGRVYGEYLYAYVDYNLRGSGSQPKIMRLKLGTSLPTIENLIWDNNYTNPFINLWDLPFTVGGDSRKIITIPFHGQSQPNLMTFKNGENQFWLLDGSKQALAYKTINTKELTIEITNAANIYVHDVTNESLATTYLTRDVLASNFAQYQTNTTYTITKKTTPEAVIENNKGNIPATLTIANGYDNNSLAPVVVKFDIVLTGFKSVKTILQPSTISIGIDQFPYEFTSPNNNATIKQFIFDNIIDDPKKNELSIANITNIALSTNPYNNKEGILFIDSITLNKYHLEDGAISTIPKSFSLSPSKIEINGFKKVLNQTTNKPEATVTGELAKLTTSIVSKNNDQLVEWLNVNQPLLLNDFVPNTKIISANITSTESSVGKITINLMVDQYFDNDVFHTRVVKNKEFPDIVLTGFMAQNLETTTKEPNQNVSGNLANILPSDINSSTPNLNDYFIDNVIVDPTGELKSNNITGFTGTPNNLLGQYTLTSITLNQTYDKDGKPAAGNTFTFSYIINGFKSTSLATAINSNPEIGLPENLKNILAQDVTIDTPGFKDYIFNNVLIDRTGLLTVANIEGIVNPNYNNINGDVKFELTINNYCNENGNLQNTSKTFDNQIITIKGFKQVLPTALNANPIILKGDPNVWADSINQTAYTQIVKDNYTSIIDNVPEGFTHANIISATSTGSSNDTGTISVDIEINLYYIKDTGLVTTSPNLILKNITISGYKTNPFIKFNNRVDVNLYDSSFANKIVGNVVSSADINLITTWLQTPAFLNAICQNELQGLPISAFSVQSINNIDNVKGEITISIIVNGGQFLENTNIVTLYGFKQTITIGEWISHASTIKGTATVPADIISNAKNQVWIATQNSPSPFSESVDLNDISVSLLSSSKVEVKMTINNFINDQGQIVTTPTEISFNVNYQIVFPSSDDNSWIYIVVFSLTGAAGLFILLWLISVIVKKYKDKWYK